MKGLRIDSDEPTVSFETPEHIRKAVEDMLERLNGFSCKDAEKALEITMWELKYASKVNFERR